MKRKRVAQGHLERLLFVMEKTHNKQFNNNSLILNFSLKFIHNFENDQHSADILPFSQANI